MRPRRQRPALPALDGALARSARACLVVAALLAGCSGAASQRPWPARLAAFATSASVERGSAKEEARPAPTTAPPVGEAPAPPREPTRERFGAAACTAGDPVELGTSEVRTLRPRISFASPGSGLIAWPTGEDHLAVRALRTADVGPPVDVELDQAIGLAALGPAGPRGFIAYAVVPLCGTGLGHACERARALAADGTPLGPPHEPEPRDQWGDVSGVASTTDALAISVAFRYGAGIGLYRVGPDGAVVVEPHPIRGEGTGDLPIRALTSDGPHVLAYGIEGLETELPFVLALGGRRQSLRMIPTESMLVRLALEGTTATVVFRPPRLRPRFVRVSITDGTIVGPARTIDASASLPPDLARIVVPELAVVRRRLVLTRRDLAGTAIGEPFEVAPVSGRPVVVSAWSGEDLGVVWATRTGRAWRLFLRRVRCGG